MWDFLQEAGLQKNKYQSGTEMAAILISQNFDLPLHLQCNSNSSIPTIRSATHREHQSMETARHHICICHVILIGLGQEFNLRLPLQCNSEFLTTEKLDSSAIISVRMGTIGSSF